MIPRQKDFIDQIVLGEVKASFWKDSRSLIFIYGTGSTAQDVQQILSQSGITIAGFLNHLPIEKLNGLPVFHPDSDNLRGMDHNQAKVILGIHNRETNVASIIGNLRSLGFSHFVSLVDLYDHFSQQLGARYWLTPRSYYPNHEARISSANELWADDKSRSLYAALLNFRLSGDYTSLPTPDLEHQYFPPDLPAWSTPLRFVDCGAYDGDTLRSSIKHNLPIEALAAFEPDNENYQRMASFVRENPDSFPNATIWPCGVYSATKQLRFSAGQGEGSAISKSGDALVQCVSLDDAIPNFAPNLIKMDIEGAEVEALQGARQTLRKFHPGLAISVYHKPEHLWEIPLLIEQLMKNKYLYFLRAHGHNDFDIILYAVPL